MSRFLSFSVLISAALLQASCALSPQQITIKPEITVPVASYGSGREINVRVEDRRMNTIIGTRGGVYGDTSTIEIGNDAKTEIAYAVSNGLARWGFKTQVNGASENTTQVVVTLTGLSYTPDPDSSQAINGQVLIKSAVSVEVMQGGRSYHGSYEASRAMGYVTVPSEEKNNEQINQVLNLALQKIFDDQALIKFFQ